MKNAKTESGDHVLAKLEMAVSDAQRSKSRVGDLMTKDVATCRPSETLNQCAKLMWDRACGSVVVIWATVGPGVLNPEALPVYWRKSVTRSNSFAPTRALMMIQIPRSITRLGLRPRARARINAN